MGAEMLYEWRGLNADGTCGLTVGGRTYSPGEQVEIGDELYCKLKPSQRAGLFGGELVIEQDSDSPDPAPHKRGRRKRGSR